MGPQGAERAAGPDLGGGDKIVFQMVVEFVGGKNKNSTR